MSNIKKVFWDQGFLILENFFDSDLMDSYNNKIKKHYGSDPVWQHDAEFISKSSAEVIPWFPYQDGTGGFDLVNEDENFNEITKSILGKGWNNLYCMMMFSKAGSQGQSWHQDCLSDDPYKFNLNRLVYTHDITDETGGDIVLMPKSHKKGILPAGNPIADLDGQIEFKPEKGTVIFLHGHCFHKVKPVKSDRISTNFRAVPKNTPRDITDVCVYRNMKYRFSTSEIIEER